MPYQLFVHNLAPTVTEKDLETVFSEVGQVTGVMRPVDRETSVPRKFAFVTVINEEIGQAVIERFNGTELQGQTIEVKPAIERKKKLDKKQVQKLATEIAKKLKEEAKRPQAQIRRIIEECGEDFARQLFTDAQNIFSSDGLMTNDATRQRTVGGVFFKLAKDRLSPEVRTKIFPSWRELKQRKKEQKAAERANQAALEVQAEVEKAKKGPIKTNDNPSLTDLEEVRRKLAELREAEKTSQQRLADIQSGKVRGGMLEAMKEVTQAKSKIATLLREYPNLK